MDLQHYQRAQRKAEEAALHSMRLQQQRSAMTMLALPSSAALWQLLRLQLLVELQRLAQEWKKTMIEMREYLLTHTVDLTMMEWCWVDQTCTLILIMPRAPQDKEIQYDLLVPAENYPPAGSAAMPLDVDHINRYSPINVDADKPVGLGQDWSLDLDCHHSPPSSPVRSDSLDSGDGPITHTQL